MTASESRVRLPASMEDDRDTLAQPGPSYSNRHRMEARPSTEPSGVNTDTEQGNTSQQQHQYTSHTSPSHHLTPARNPPSSSAIITSPPRYATRSSLGSVAFSPGKSPGSTARNRPAVDSYLPYQGNTSSSNAPSQQQQQPSYSTQQYEYYAGHHASKAPAQNDSTLDLSPELQYLEAHLNNHFPPSTPNHSHLQESSASSSTTSGKKRALPAPLDLSPPRPARTRSQDQHPILHSHANTSSSSSSRVRATSNVVQSSSHNLPNDSSLQLGGVGGIDRQPYTGLGLGLPFSHSNTSESLASMASSSSSGKEMSQSYNGKLPSPTTNDSLYPSPSTSFGQTPSFSPTNVSSSAFSSRSRNYNNNQAIRRQRSASDVLLSSPEEGRSPIVDRKGLIGLGELSTPRWTAAIHERRWNHHPHQQSSSSSTSTNQKHNGLPRLPLHEEEENSFSERDGQHHGQSEVESSEGGWEGSVLGGYMDEKENDDAYANYRKSMPAADSYRSFSDIAAMTTTGERGGQMSNSSSQYSLDALSVPESHSSSSLSSEGGDFYTPSLRPGTVQDPLANYRIAQRQPSATSIARDNTQEDTFKIPKDRQGNEMLNSSTSTILSPNTSKIRSPNTASGGISSRTSSRSTTSTSVQFTSRKTSSVLHKDKERDIPSYMRGTAASANKRSSTTSIDDIYRKQDTLPSPTYQDDYTRNPVKIRHASSPSHHFKSTPAARTPASRHIQEPSSSSTRQSGHSRQSSMNSNSGSKKVVPTPINTNRDALPTSTRHSHSSHQEIKQPTSAKTSKSPSAIAHHILQQTLQQQQASSNDSSFSGIDRLQAFEEFDISAYAASNHATAEALSKLDGTLNNPNSPRMSRAFSTCSSNKSNNTTIITNGKESIINDNRDMIDHNTPKKSNLSRANSKNSNRTSSPHSRPSSSSRKGWAASAGSVGRGTSIPSPRLSAFASKDGTEPTSSASSVRRKSDDQAAFSPGQTLQPPSKSPLRVSSMVPTPHSAPQVQLPRRVSLSSSISTPSLPAAGLPQSSMNTASRSPAIGSNGLSPAAPSGQPLSPAVPSRRGSGNRPSSSSGGDIPPTPSLSSKRSSSASLAFGTSTSGSRDSTSATSVSVYGSPAQNKMSKSRRGSTSSDVSSVHSSGVDGTNRSDRSPGADLNDSEQAFARLIPPVPPLPKDWELYRPSTTGGDSSVPTSASGASFKERDNSRISAMQGLGVADYRPNQQGQISRSSSMEKPVGPRPLRDVSNSSLSPAAGNSPRLVSASNLPSPATSSTTSSNGLPERQHNASKTPTKPKWSLSNAFGMNKSPTIPTSYSQSSSLSSFSSSSLEKSTSFSDLAAVARDSQPAANRMSLASNESQSELSRRKLASVPDIKSLAASSAQSAPEIKLQGLPHSVSAYEIGGRARTDSQSSVSTANASKRSDGHHGLPTSPGRSLSSLLSSGRKESSSRHTPSGIPFWSRRPSASHGAVATPLSPASRKSSASGEGLGIPSTPGQGEEKTGRRSILGINLFGRSSARKSLTLNKDNMPPSPGLPQHYAASNRASTTSKTVKHDDKVSELGVRGSQESKRNSVGARASSLIGRKRGKTLPSNTEPPLKPESVYLPPMQMSALPTTSALRLPSSSADERGSESGTPQKRPLPVPPRLHRPSRVGESMNGKAQLPTITGSPSVAINAPAENCADASGSLSKPPTPTRIPRLAGSRSNVSSPQYLDAPTTPSLDIKENGSDTSYRRGSLRPGAGISSSVPEQNSSYLKAERDDVNHSSSSSSQDTPVSLEESDKQINEAPKRRVLGASTSQVPVLSSSRTSGKYQPAAVSTPSEKRRSLLLSEKEDFKPTRSPLKVSQPTSISNFASKAQSTASASSSTAALSTGSARVRTKTSETPLSQRKTSTLTDGLPTSRSMGSSLVSKLSIPTRMSKSATTSSLQQSPAPSDNGGRSTSSSRYGTPVGEDEIRGDEEMLEFVQRQRTKQASRGMSEEEIDRLFTFPEPIEATRALSPQSALQLYRHEMCEYEMDEIMAYKEVYYVGRRDNKKMATKSDATNNHGYDDERGDYQIIEGDHIQYRYEIIDTLGKGSFGQVLRCRDHSTGDMVAVKIIRNKKRFHHQALVEIKVLENLKRWDPEEKNCLLVIGEHFTFRGHLCITTELLGINLYELIKANSFRGFSTTLIRRFTVQILASLSLLRHHRVVHCDLKPENILLKHPAKSAVKVIDFGSSCFENEKVYTYIQSRFYRSPEVILGMNYHMAIDMWSLGCILAELYTGMPIFPGENEASQLACIMEVLGVPDKHIVDRSSRKKLFFDSTGTPRPTVDSKGRRRRPGAKTLQSVLKCDDELFVDFIAKCLTWDPDRRLKPGPALRHPFCAKGRTIASAPIPPRFSTTSTRNLLRSSNISTPRRLEKKPLESSSVYSTPATRHDASIPSTAPVQRMRTISAAVPSSVGPAHTSYRSYAK